MTKGKLTFAIFFYTALAVLGKDIEICETRLSRDDSEKTVERLTLRISISSRLKGKIDPNEVALMVYIYDKKNGKIEETNSDIEVNWKSRPVDWKSGFEVIDVTYTNSEVGAKFYGYVLKLYYKERLQCSKVEPASLSGETKLE